MAHPASADTSLVRALGVRTLTASIVNATIGAGIFVLPAAVGSLGAGAPVAYLVCAGAMALIVTCFAMAGSRVALTGGLYAYVEVAFGRFPGFLTGILLWLSCVLGAAGVVSALAASLAVFIPPLAAVGLPRALFIFAVIGALAIVNVRGVRGAGRLVEWVTVAKLVPLVAFVAVGLFFIRPDTPLLPALPPAGTLGDSALLLIFAFIGIEVALVPSGEVVEPARTVPRAIFLALGLTTLVYLAIQFVAQGVLGADLARYGDAPLAEAARRVLGPTGQAAMVAGAMVSMFGYASGDMLGSPRLLFAFGRDGLLPPALARVHARYRTPHVAILVYAVLVAGLAVLGSFGVLALLSNIATLSVYLLCCAGAWELARRDVRSGGVPFRAPGGPAVPLLACVAILWLLSHATWQEIAAEAAVLALASLFYLMRWRFQAEPPPSAQG